MYMSSVSINVSRIRRSHVWKEGGSDELGRSSEVCLSIRSDVSMEAWIYDLTIYYLSKKVGTI